MLKYHLRSLATKATVLLLLVLGSCFEEFNIIYKIPAGEHYSTPRDIIYVDRDPFIFWAKFDESATHCATEDINKLYGFSDCNSSVHDDSARFGWRWWEGRLEIFAYVYANGERKFQSMGSIPLNTWVKFQIKMGKGEYIFRLGTNEVSMSRANDCHTGIYLQLNPYFGGDTTCNKDIFINIKQ